MLDHTRFLAAVTAIACWLVTFPLAAQDVPSTVNLWQPGDPGEPLHIRGRVLSTDGAPIPGAVLHIRQADGTGEYQPDRYQTTLRTGDDGEYGLGTVLPGQYYGMKHIHVVVMHEAYEAVQTQILFKGDPNLDESAYGDHAIALEEARIKGNKVLFGQFDIVMRPAGSS